MDFLDFDERSQPLASRHSPKRAIAYRKYRVWRSLSTRKKTVRLSVSLFEIEIAGEDFMELGRLAQDIRKTIADIPGLVGSQG